MCGFPAKNVINWGYIGKIQKTPILTLLLDEHEDGYIVTDYHKCALID